MISSKFNGRRLYYSAHEGVYQDTLPKSDADSDLIQAILTTPIKRRSVHDVAQVVGLAACVVAAGVAFVVQMVGA